MDKRSEIREGIAMAINDAPATLSNEGLADQILIYLHSQGVVIKVGGKLPSIVDNKGEFRTGLEYRGEIIKAGCGFFEPLIEEGK